MATVAEARIRACQRWPYANHAILSLVPVESRAIAVMAVDQHWRLYWNPDGIRGLSIDDAAGIVLHEVYHLVLAHHKRAGSMVPAGDDAAFDDWNVAADFAINDALLNEGIDMHGIGLLYPEQQGFERGLAAETYFKEIRRRREEETQKSPEDNGGERDTQADPEAESQSPDEDGDGDADDSQSGGEPEAGTDEPVEDESRDANGAGDEGEGDSAPAGRPATGSGSCADGRQRDWEQGEPTDEAPGIQEHQAAQIVRTVAEKTIGSGAGGAMLEWAKRVVEPRLDPRAKLLSLVRASVDAISGIGEYTYRRQNRRSQPDAPLPGSMQPVPRIVVIVDTSGSMGEDDLALALGIIGKVLKSIPNRDGIKVICGDAQRQTAAKVFTPQAIELKGGGGTDMTALIVEAAAEKPAPQLILVATDGETGWPDKALRMPVVACLTRKPTYCALPPVWVKTVMLNA